MARQAMPSWQRRIRDCATATRVRQFTTILAATITGMAALGTKTSTSAADGESVERPTDDKSNVSTPEASPVTTNSRPAPLSLGSLCELHCHLDGSLRAQTFLELRRKLPSATSAACNTVATTKPVFDTVDNVYNCLCFQNGWSLQR